MSKKILLLELQYTDYQGQVFVEYEWAMVNSYIIDECDSFLPKIDKIYNKFKQTIEWDNLKACGSYPPEPYQITKDKLEEIITICENKYNNKLPLFGETIYHYVETREGNIFYYADTSSDADYRFSIHKIIIDE